MDSDGQHTVEDAKKLYHYVKEHPEELALGKRNRDKKIPLKSKIGNELTRIIYYLTTGLNIYDTQTGLRCFSNKLIDYMLSIPGERYEYEMNVLLQSPKEKVKVKEIEIKTIYIDNNSGSHFHPLKDSLKIYIEILKFSLSSFISFLIDYSFYAIFVLLGIPVLLANVISRIISATGNYTINKKIVFKDNSKNFKTIGKYISLATIILCFNTIILKYLILLGGNKYISKILVEIILFFFSWYIQKKKIFIKGECH